MNTDYRHESHARMRIIVDILLDGNNGHTFHERPGRRIAYEALNSDGECVLIYDHSIGQYCVQFIHELAKIIIQI